MKIIKKYSLYGEEYQTVISPSRLFLKKLKGSNIIQENVFIKKTFSIDNNSDCISIMFSNGDEDFGLFFDFDFNVLTYSSQLFIQKRLEVYKLLQEIKNIHYDEINIKNRKPIYRVEGHLNHINIISTYSDLNDCADFTFDYYGIQAQYFNSKDEAINYAQSFIDLNSQYIQNNIKDLKLKLDLINNQLNLEQKKLERLRITFFDND